MSVDTGGAWVFDDVVASREKRGQNEQRLVEPRFRIQKIGV